MRRFDLELQDRLQRDKQDKYLNGNIYDGNKAVCDLLVDAMLLRSLDGRIPGAADWQAPQELDEAGIDGPAN